jgi:uncharacterized protein YcbX
MILREIGFVEALFRYPVKSMCGESLESAAVGWHGIDGDRRFAFRQIENRTDFPWLSASRLPDLLRFTPLRRNDQVGGDLPTHVSTPDGDVFPILSDELASDVSGRLGAPVQMMSLRSGVFDEASISVISIDTVREIGDLAGLETDVRRFRPNIVVRTHRATPFLEDEWVGSVLLFGQTDDAASIMITMPDLRCSMINLDPDSTVSAPQVMKSVARANKNNAGVYGLVSGIGRLAVGQAVFICTEADRS